ncbi:hypothetical protein STEG23_022996, partial [Scotinomys teguina]
PLSFLSIMRTQGLRGSGQQNQALLKPNVKNLDRVNSDLKSRPSTLVFAVRFQIFKMSTEKKNIQVRIKFKIVPNENFLSQRPLRTANESSLRSHDNELYFLVEKSIFAFSRMVYQLKDFN